MKKFKNAIMLSALILAGGALSSCNNSSFEESLEITYEEGKTTLTRGEKFDLNFKVKEESKIKANDVKFTIIAGNATINEDGLLSVSKDAVVGSDIIVKAEAKIVVDKKEEIVESELVKFKVVDLLPTSIVLTATPSIITRDNAINFKATYEPEYSTLKDYTLSLDENCDFAEIVDGNKVVLKEDADLDAINGKTFDVIATLDADKKLTSKVTISVNTTLDIDELTCETISIVAKKDGTKTIVTTGLDSKGRETSLSPNLLTYTVDPKYENILSVNEDGAITPKGHGKAIVTVSYGEGENIVSTECVVYVMVAPEQFKLTTTNNHIKTTKTINIAANDDKYFDIPFETLDGEMIGSKEYNVKLEMADNSNTVNESEIGEYKPGFGFKFKKPGTVKAIITSNSSLNNVVIDPSYEIKEVLTFKVNDGVNIRTIEDYVNYATTKEGTIANILDDVEINQTNYKDHYVGEKFKTFHYTGSRHLEGNGYTFSVGEFKKDSFKYSSYDLFRFGYNVKAPKVFDVELNDWNIAGTLTEKDIKIIEGVDPKAPRIPFRWGLSVTGTGNREVDPSHYDSIATSVGSLDINNVKVSGFEYGARFSNAIESNIVNFTSLNNFINGVDNDQSHLNFTNFTCKTVGMFAMEVVDDRIDGKVENLDDIHGKAGANFDEPASFSFKGTTTIDNWNSGSDTIPMTGEVIDGTGITMPMVINGIYQDTAARIVQEAEGKPLTESELKEKVKVINELFAKSIQGNVDGENKFNFFTLIFMDPSDYNPLYKGGNMEQNICKFNTDKVINFKDLGLNYYKNQNYHYDNKEFIILDLILPEALGMGKDANVGQAVFFNSSFAK